MDTTAHLKSEIERAAKALNRKPTTIGRLVGQGGHFYRRLCEGKRVWPDTADTVLSKLEQLCSPSSDVSQPMVSCPPKDVGTARADCKGNAA